MCACELCGCQRHRVYIVDNREKSVHSEKVVLCTACSERANGTHHSLQDERKRSDVRRCCRRKCFPFHRIVPPTFLSMCVCLCRAPLHSTPLHFTPLHSTPLHSTPLRSTPLHSAPLHFTPLTPLCSANTHILAHTQHTHTHTHWVHETSASYGGVCVCVCLHTRWHVGQQLLQLFLFLGEHCFQPVASGDWGSPQQHITPHNTTRHTAQHRTTQHNKACES